MKTNWNGVEHRLHNSNNNDYIKREIYEERKFIIYIAIVCKPSLFLAFFIDHLYNNRLLVFNYKKRSNTLLVISAYISVFFSSY